MADEGDEHDDAEERKASNAETDERTTRLIERAPYLAPAIKRAMADAEKSGELLGRTIQATMRATVRETLREMNRGSGPHPHSDDDDDDKYAVVNGHESGTPEWFAAMKEITAQAKAQSEVAKEAIRKLNAETAALTRESAALDADLKRLDALERENAIGGRHGD